MKIDKSKRRREKKKKQQSKTKSEAELNKAKRNETKIQQEILFTQVAGKTRQQYEW